MPVTRDHLRRDRLRLEAEPLAGDALDLGVDGRVGADGARELPDAVRFERAHETGAPPVELEGPAGELPAEGRRLRVDAVRTADADRVAVLLGAPDDRVEGTLDARE